MTTKDRIANMKSPRIVYELEYIVTRIENRDWGTNTEYKELLRYKQDLEIEIDRRLTHIK